VVQQDVLEGGLPQQGVQGQLAVGSTQVGQQGVKGFISGGKDLKEEEAQQESKVCETGREPQQRQRKVAS